MKTLIVMFFVLVNAALVIMIYDIEVRVDTMERHYRQMAAVVNIQHDRINALHALPTNP